MATKRVKKSNKLPTYGKLAGWLLLGVSLVTGGILLSQQPAGAADIVVYKSPTCGCCKKWIDHLKDNGFTVEVHNQRNMNPVKKELGVPRHLQSCHTAKVGGYVVEGHVPANLIVRLLKDKPQIKGLAVPGMPMGSPGMEGPRSDAYDILTFQQNGKTTVYASR
ncbi:MAG: DUF411 domain-containing protein [Candidatus Thiodiazotropha sp. (ex Codakia rugifera)]|nr:DUF411 domain-containing protein [Candidatus Thiodiazotropha sp. (ex Codakia rugifera)]